jgi:hypothetical protein
VAIDTLKVARRLREAGFTEPQAEALVAAVQEGADFADLVTKHDLAEQVALLRGEMRETEQRLLVRIEAAKADMIGRMMSMIIGAVLVNIVAMLGAMFAFAKMLGH